MYNHFKLSSLPDSNGVLKYLLRTPQPSHAIKIFSRIFSYINLHLFNSLPFHHECCTFRNEEYVESELAELELWYGQTKEDDLYPILSIQSLYRICILYWDDNYNTRSISPNVISSTWVLMPEDSNDTTSDSSDTTSSTFTLQDLDLRVKAVSPA
ncbi:hypothetical protein VitviT2T_024561 [Vitis vinifera]|uniref:Dilute domain-containing protein n=1 Tax=Vitis vinifera TaxID=29760 RepID=A0ABY9DG48_VITVI|nr:hypothetical protein VitviT2T_024561 [Vitis vinifera]